MAFFEESAFHVGETEMHKLLRVPNQENPTSPFLTPHAANLLVRAPLLALGTLDADGRPWTTLWGGESGFSRPVAQNVIYSKATVDRVFDPVAEALLGTRIDGQVVQEEGKGKMVGGLAIDLEMRRRVKLYGRLMASSMLATEEGIGEAQLVVGIEQSLGNCPKYLNKKHIVPHLPQPKLRSDKLPLSQEAAALIQKSDLFFISSSNHNEDMDTNHRGGPPGFVRILSNDENGVTLVYPEYSGNRLYQTLGNLRTTPQAGIIFPDFDTGNALYVTGKTEILAGENASNLVAHTNLAIKIHVVAVRFVTAGLAYRAQEGEYSPYNPPIRYLSTEGRHGVNGDERRVYAKLIGKTILTPTIGRFRFQLEGTAKRAWKPGQYVALGFHDELDAGYSHMRDDDPASLNDDFLRTFTVSSRQDEVKGDSEFEITIRKAGPVTHHLFRTLVRTELTVPIQGFGGEFFTTQAEREHISFVAGGVGITPLLAQAPDLDLERLKLYWTNKIDDLDFILDTFDRISGFATSTTVFLTGDPEKADSDKMSKLKASKATVHMRRMTKDDFQGDKAETFYLCTGMGLRSTLVEWLQGKKVVYEDFNF